MLFEKTCIHFSRSIPSLARLLAPLPSAPSHQPATCLLWRCLQRSHGNGSCDQSTKRRAPGNSGCSWSARLELRFASRRDDLLLPRVDSSTIIRTVSDFNETRNGRLIVGARREFQFDHSKRPGKSDARECEPDKYECVSCVIDVCFLLRRDVVTSFIACKLFRGTYMYVYGRV